jgi:F0F1-type ATP synthase assembly protein I
VLAAQAGLALIASIVCAAIWGWAAGGWSLVGGFVCVAPSALLAVRLERAARPGGNFGAALLIGELLKIALVVSLLLLAYAHSGRTNSLAVLLGFIGASQGFFLALIFTGR